VQVSTPTDSKYPPLQTHFLFTFEYPGMHEVQLINDPQVAQRVGQARHSLKLSEG